LFVNDVLYYELRFKAASRKSLMEGNNDVFLFQENLVGGYLDDDGRPFTAFDGLKKVLAKAFDLLEDKNMPFVIRETARKNQWTVAHCTIWRRKK
jgi:hypothetical protein